MAIKNPQQHGATWQAGSAAATVLAWVVGWQHIAMESQNPMGGGASGESVEVFIGLEANKWIRHVLRVDD